MSSNMSYFSASREGDNMSCIGNNADLTKIKPKLDMTCAGDDKFREMNYNKKN